MAYIGHDERQTHTKLVQADARLQERNEELAARLSRSMSELEVSRALVSSASSGSGQATVRAAASMPNPLSPR
jgi:hypothetical protein